MGAQDARVSVVLGLSALNASEEEAKDEDIFIPCITSFERVVAVNFD